MNTRSQYWYDLGELQRALLQLSEAVEHAITESIRALLRNDAAIAQRIKRNDDDIDERRATIEERVLRVIAAQQPLASDLRFLLACLRIADELERMGDYAEGIAEIVLRRDVNNAMQPPPMFGALVQQVQTMLGASVAAFVSRDADAAAQLDQADDQVDALTQEVQQAMLAHMQRSPGDAHAALYYLFVAHNLERIADRAVNIAERAAFIATGTLRPAAATA